MRNSTKIKIDSIQRTVNGKSVLVAFSGGVDSTTLARIVKDTADRVKLLLIKSPTVPEIETEDAYLVARELGLDLIVKEFDWLSQEELYRNETDRCFRCKQLLSKMWSATAESLGFDIVIEGTTASELKGYRPGLRALSDSGVRSPFLDADMTKDEIREYAREQGLSVAETPSMACLATRFPYGTTITHSLLSMVERVEKGVMEVFGVHCVRARYHGDLVRIEVPAEDLERLCNSKKREQLVDIAHAAGFSYVTADLRGYRTGAMDEGLNLGEA